MICCNDLGELFEARGELDTARSLFDRALQVRQELGAVRMGYVHGSMASSLLAVATVAAKQGDIPTAERLLRGAAPLAEESRARSTSAAGSTSSSGGCRRPRPRTEPRFDPRAVLGTSSTTAPTSTCPT